MIIEFKYPAMSIQNILKEVVLPTLHRTRNIFIKHTVINYGGLLVKVVLYISPQNP